MTSRSRFAKPSHASPLKPGKSAVSVLEDLTFSEGLALRTGAAADILAPNLRLLFVAINPSPLSAATLRPFSSPTNAFWRLLFVSGLTPVLIAPEQSRKLLEFGCGLISLAERATRLASEVFHHERKDGAVRVREIIRRVRPEVVALLGPTIAPLFLESHERTGVGWKTTRLEASDVFVLPNPSGRNRAYPGFQHKLIWYQQLAARWP
jgi:TDG/mug DNA glycosylase family protein